MVRLKARRYCEVLNERKTPLQAHVKRAVKVGEKMRHTLSNLKGSVISDEELQNWLLELDIDSMKCALSPVEIKLIEEPIEKTYERILVKVESVESPARQENQPKLRSADRSVKRRSK